ncbi:hypothetical protein IWW38_003729 [Coemansia aciculifera]|uniref:Uncharacterized protein n=1 Tax=Coemansia aciculifera TaxID=417176 RepID=A0ACC1M1K6_9FUNG|nr:hypothetical protein IWW38_003729 [Coemansia aciculifera]
MAAGSTHGEGFRLAVHTAVVMAGTKSSTASPVIGSPVRLDEVLLAEFKEFATQAQSPRSTTYMTLPYIKNVISEDIEPCLRFGPRPRISSRNVLDAIASNRLQIEEMTPQIAAEMRRLQQAAERTDGHRRAMLWERFSGTVAANPSGCQACGRECQCTYRFRMGLKADSEWIQLDTICRDRLVAACEFYGFVRYLRQGIFASRSVMDLYTETIRLRLCMFYARIGAYGYAVDLDPSLTEPNLFTRSFSAPPLPESPTALGHSALALTASPITAPYVNVGRSASTMSVTMLDTGGSAMPEASTSQLGVNAGGSQGSRYRSVSHEVSAMSIPVTQMASASPVNDKEDAVREVAADAATNSRQDTTPDDDLDNVPLSTSNKADTPMAIEPGTSPILPISS